MSDLIFNCPHCAAAVSCSSEFAGQTLACPHCQGGIIAPQAEVEVISDQSPVAREQSAVISEQETSPEISETDTVAQPEFSSPNPTTRLKKPELKGEPVEAAEGEALVIFNCPGCGEELDIPESAIGDPVACPDCGVEVTDAVPKPQKPSEAPHPSAAETPTGGKKKIIFKKKA